MCSHFSERLSHMHSSLTLWIVLSIPEWKQTTIATTSFYNFPCFLLVLFFVPSSSLTNSPRSFFIPFSLFFYSFSCFVNMLLSIKNRWQGTLMSLRLMVVLRWSLALLLLELLVCWDCVECLGCKPQFNGQRDRSEIF